MAFCQDQGKFYIVNLIVNDVESVAIVPDFWYHTNGWCKYPNTKGTGAITARAAPNDKWHDYRAYFRSHFDSFNDARLNLVKASNQSDINAASETELGKGKRKKYTKKPFSPMASSSARLDDEQTSSDDCDLDSPSQMLSLIEIPKTLAGNPVLQGQKVTESSNSDKSRCTSSDGSQKSNFVELRNPDSNSQLLHDSTQAVSTVGVYGSLTTDTGFNSVGSISSMASNSQLLHNSTQSVSTVGVYDSLTSESGFNSVGSISSTASNSQLLHNSTQAVSTVGVYDSPTSDSSFTSVGPISSMNPRNSTPMGIQDTATPQLPQKDICSGSSSVVQKENRLVHFGATGQVMPQHSQWNYRNPNIDHHILTTLKQIQEQQKKFDAKLTQIESYKASETEKSSVPDFSELPVLFENLDEFEDNLSLSKQKYNNLVAIVRSIGGTSLSDAVKRTVNKILHVDAQANCNWNGKKRGAMKKHGLSSSPITKAVFEGIRQISQFEHARESELEYEMKKTICHAPEKTRKRMRTPSPTPTD